MMFFMLKIFTQCDEKFSKLKIRFILICIPLYMYVYEHDNTFVLKIKQENCQIIVYNNKKFSESVFFESNI